VTTDPVGRVLINLPEVQAVALMFKAEVATSFAPNGGFKVNLVSATTTATTTNKSKNFMVSDWIKKQVIFIKSQETNSL
jgi:hypothetical protein